MNDERADAGVEPLTRREAETVGAALIASLKARAAANGGVLKVPPAFGGLITSPRRPIAVAKAPADPQAFERARRKAGKGAGQKASAAERARHAPPERSGMERRLVED